MKVLGIAAMFAMILPVMAADELAWKALMLEGIRMAQTGQYRSADDVVQRALHEAEEFGLNDVRVAYSLNQAGVIHYCLGRFSEAEQAYQRGIRILEGRADHWKVLARIFTDLGELYVAVGGRNTEAEQAFRRALELAVSALGPKHPDLIDPFTNLAGAVMLRNDLAEARGLFERARALVADPNALPASPSNGLGVLMWREGKPEEALPYMTRATEGWRKEKGVSHPNLIRPLLNSARVYLELNRAPDALPLLREARSIAEATLGRTHPALGEILASLSIAVGKTGGRKEARELDRRSVAILKLYPGRIMTVNVADLRPERK
jgi:tetratricopeptide (TPR) repeat protein